MFLFTPDCRCHPENIGCLPIDVEDDAWPESLTLTISGVEYGATPPWVECGEDVEEWTCDGFNGDFVLDLVGWWPSTIGANSNASYCYLYYSPFSNTGDYNIDLGCGINATLGYLRTHVTISYNNDTRTRRVETEIDINGWCEMLFANEESDADPYTTAEISELVLECETETPCANTIPCGWFTTNSTMTITI